MKHSHLANAVRLIVITTSLTACGNPVSSPTSNSSPTPSPSPANFQVGGGWGICCSLMGAGDSISCEAPKTNCFDEVVVKAGPAKNSLRLLDESIGKGTTANFFAGEEWKKIFPGLEKFPDQLSLLRNGLPLLRFESKTKGLVRYLGTRQRREEIVRQMQGDQPKPITGVEFALTVREEQ